MVSVIRYIFYVAVVAILIAILDTTYRMSDKVDDANIKISVIEQKLQGLDIECTQDIQFLYQYNIMATKTVPKKIKVLVRKKPTTTPLKIKMMKKAKSLLA